MYHYVSSMDEEDLGWWEELREQSGGHNAILDSHF